MKTLLQGKPYTNAANTDIRKTFARLKRELREQRRVLDAIEAERVSKVANIKGRG